MPSTIKSLKLLTDEIRLRMVLLLEQEALSVAELQNILGLGQSGVSTKLAQLKKEGLVHLNRSGKNSIYTSELPSNLQPIVQEMAEELPSYYDDVKALQHTLKKRKDLTRAYFDQLAGKFGRHYVPGRSWKSIAEALLKILNYKVVADLGAGEGTLSQLLAQRADHVIAVDNSERMVEFGQQLAQEHHLPNLEYRLGDLETPPIKAKSVDLVIFSQALHHANKPLKALQSAHDILKSGGSIVILDLLQHNFEKARELYYDNWLGFGEAELSEMLTKAGFQSIETTIVDKEEAPPHFQTLLATAYK